MLRVKRKESSSAFPMVSVRSGTQSFAWGALISAQDQNFLSSLSNTLPLTFFLYKMGMIVSQRLSMKQLEK